MLQRADWILSPHTCGHLLCFVVWDVTQLHCVSILNTESCFPPPPPPHQQQNNNKIKQKLEDICYRFWVEIGKIVQFKQQLHIFVLTKLELFLSFK